MFEITGKVVSVSDIQSRKTFDFIEFVVENKREVRDQVYTDTYAFTLGGKSLDSVAHPRVGDVSTIKFSIRSNEHNGKYYTSLQAFSIELKEAASTENTKIKESAAPAPASSDDDLPF